MLVFFILVTFSLFAFGLYLLLVRGQEEYQRVMYKRLESLLRSETAETTTEEAIQILREEVESQLPWLQRLALRFRLGNELFRLIEQADANIRPHQLLLLIFGLAVSVGVLMWVIRGSLLATMVMGMLAGAAPVFYLVRVRRRRLSQFLEQLPDALDLMTRALRAGHAFGSALNTVATEMPDPIAKEFRRTFEEQNLGMSLKVALEHLIERVPLLDLRLCVTAILIQKETGGNLAEILENIAAVIRDRFRILGQVRVYTAQGRMTGWIIGLIPFALAFYIYLVSPDYIEVLFTHPTGKTMALMALVFEGIGMLMIRRIINIAV
ncbi:MAG: type II secretion system F family protein [Blastocatellia bacterium]|nr:type II secretion system F family protein [Blastocatellia bacterium]